MTDPSTGVLSEKIRHLPFLVVETNPALGKSVAATLATAGVTSCEVATSGAAAWQAWKKKREFGVVLAGWDLPEMPGLELLRRIRADPLARLQPAFVIMAGEENPEAAQQAVASGADCFLPKPFPKDGLIPMVNEAVAHRNQIARDGGLGAEGLEGRILAARPTVELIFERYSTAVECEELSTSKCVLKVENNYGLGTLLNLRFARPGGGEEPFYKVLKGTVTKIERVPKEYGWFRLHLELRGPIREQHGITEILAAGAVKAPGG